MLCFALTSPAVRRLCARSAHRRIVAAERLCARNAAPRVHVDDRCATLARQVLTINAAGIRINSRHSESLGTWPTESQLLALTGISRATFTRHAQRAGFTPALRFLHVLRVLAVASALRAGRVTIECVASRYGYTSTGTLRRHFHEVTGLVPSSARRLSMAELVQQIRAVAPGGHPTIAPTA